MSLETSFDPPPHAATTTMTTKFYLTLDESRTTRFVCFVGAFVR